VQNNGPVDEPRLATVIGMQTTGVGQPDEEVYSQSMMVSDPVGGGATTWGFQNFVPDNNSSIHWIATISDDDPDEDIDTIMPAIRVCP